MDHHLALILAEVLNRVALTGVAVEGQNRGLLGKFIFQYAIGEGVGCVGGDGSEFVVMRHSYFLDSLLHKLVEIWDTDELLYLSPRVIVLVSLAGTR